MAAAKKKKAKSSCEAPAAGAMADMPVRDRICYAAFGAFLEHGYEGTSTLMIATRAKVSKRELNAHFRNKREMFAAGVASRTRRMSQPLDLPQAQNRTALAATLFGFGRTFLREVTQPEVTAVIRLVLADASRSGELAETFYKIGREPPRLALIRLFARAGEAGLIGGADPERVAGQGKNVPVP